MKNTILLLTAATLLTACATQRYGREAQLSSAERDQLTCKQIRLEIAKTESFLSDLAIQRADTNIAHVAGFLGDFGIGNALEGDAAEKSGQVRLKQLKELKTSKRCK